MDEIRLQPRMLTWIPFLERWYLTRSGGKGRGSYKGQGLESAPPKMGRINHLLLNSPCTKLLWALFYFLHCLCHFLKKPNSSVQLFMNSRVEEVCSLVPLSPESRASLQQMLHKFFSVKSLRDWIPFFFFTFHLYMF